jgi:hypothetical protein
VPRREEGDNLAAVSVVEDNWWRWRCGGVGRGIELCARTRWVSARRRASGMEERGIRRGRAGHQRGIEL